MTAIFSIRALEATDRESLADLTGSNLIITPSGDYDIRDLPGFLAVQDGIAAGLVTYHIEEQQGDQSCEIVTLHARQQAIGIGTALINTVHAVARNANCNRLWLVTSNDNLHALGFYQKRGFRLVTIHRNAMDQVRARKPEVPMIGMNGIPLRDVIELEILLT